MILDDIVRSKRAEVERHRASRPLASLRERPAYGRPRRGFREALDRPGRAIIAEIKKASPSRGVICEDFRPSEIARSYEAAGARALSVLTDAPFFQGSLEVLETVRTVVDLPLLRKDFILDPYQIEEARAFGADAVLLIAAILADEDLRELREAAEAAGLDALVEVHTRSELERAVASGARLFGINNRDLRTFVTRLDVALELAPALPPGAIGVAESGLRSRHDLERLEAAGVRAFLVGEWLMEAPDPGVRLRELAG